MLQLRDEQLQKRVAAERVRLRGQRRRRRAGAGRRCRCDSGRSSRVAPLHAASGHREPQSRELVDDLHLLPALFAAWIPPPRAIAQAFEREAPLARASRQRRSASRTAVGARARRRARRSIDRRLQSDNPIPVPDERRRRRCPVAAIRRALSGRARRSARPRAQSGLGLAKTRPLRGASAVAAARLLLAPQLERGRRAEAERRPWLRAPASASMASASRPAVSAG